MVEYYLSLFIGHNLLVCNDALFSAGVSEKTQTKARADKSLGRGRFFLIYLRIIAFV